VRGAKAVFLLALAVWSLVLAPGVGWAKGNRELKKGIAAYRDLEYERAIKLLKTALKKKLDKDNQVDAHRYIALSYLALGKKDEAREAIKNLLEIDPQYALPATESPVALELFEEEKKAISGAKPEPDRTARPEKPARPDKAEPVTPPPAPTPPADTTPSLASPVLEATLDPASPGPGSAVTVTLMVLPADLPIEAVVVHHRVRGKGTGYSTVRAELEGGGRWKAVIPGAFVEAPGMEYYAVAQDEDASARARLGSESEPQLIAVGEDSAPTGAPFYSRWWFWATVGGVLLAGAAVGVVVATGGDDGGGGETGFIDVTIVPPP
jgi:tetratricopeptide (TPR) repeat protein